MLLSVNSNNAETAKRAKTLLAHNASKDIEGRKMLEKKETVEMLRGGPEGVKRWNVWRNANHSVKVDLSGAKLSEANLSGVDFRGADLSGADLTEAILTRAILAGADLSGADLTGAILAGADLWGADLTEAILTEAILTEAILTEAILAGAKFYFNIGLKLADWMRACEQTAKTITFAD